jgi:hypothetical protein
MIKEAALKCQHLGPSPSYFGSMNNLTLLMVFRCFACAGPVDPTTALKMHKQIAATWLGIALTEFKNVLPVQAR